MLKIAFFFVNVLLGVYSGLVFRNPDNVIENEIVTQLNNNADVPPDKYIAYGSPVIPGWYPWMVGVRTKYVTSGEVVECGGSLISNSHVLTAAHCVEATQFLIEVKIYLGDYDLNTFPVDCVKDKCTKNKIVYTRKIKLHDQYDDRTMTNDIALLTLQKPVTVTAYVKPILLLPFNVDKPSYDRRHLVVLGWGATEDSMESDVLQHSTVNLISKQRCRKMVELSVPEYHVCAGGPGFKDSCEGDSGGPLMFFYKDEYHLAGLVSFGPPGIKCGESKVGFYTNVFHYKDWIKSNM